MTDEILQDEIVAFAQEIIRINSPSGEEQGAARVIQRKMETLNYESIQMMCEKFMKFG